MQSSPDSSPQPLPRGKRVHVPTPGPTAAQRMDAEDELLDAALTDADRMASLPAMPAMPAMRTPSPDADMGLDVLLGRMAQQAQLASPKTPEARPESVMPSAPSKRDRDYRAALAASSSSLLTPDEQRADCQRRKRGLIEYLADSYEPKKED